MLYSQGSTGRLGRKKLPSPNRDRACDELANAIDTSSDQQRLWVADEHHLSEQLLNQLAVQNIQLISNRYDQFTRAKQAGVKAVFNDFDLCHPQGQKWDSIFFRVSKEKAVVHRIINSAVNLLQNNGNLWISGYKNEGTKTYLTKAAKALGSTPSVKRSKEQLFVAQIGLNEAGELLADDDYSQLRRVEMSKAQTFWSKPGLFGWKRIDQGSAFLVESLTELAKSGDLDIESSSVLDLGCGYGYLASAAAELNAKSIVATDNCKAAILACQKNLEKFSNQNYLCQASDCAKEVEGKFDLILCNPPFHAGFSSSSELHHKFIEAIRTKLSPDGQALVVVNQFLRLKALCEENGLKILSEQRDNKRHFDLYRLTRTR